MRIRPSLQDIHEPFGVQSLHQLHCFEAPCDLSPHDRPPCQCLNQIPRSNLIQAHVTSLVFGQGLLDQHWPAFLLVSHEHWLPRVRLDRQVGVGCYHLGIVPGMDRNRKMATFALICLDYPLDQPRVLT